MAVEEIEDTWQGNFQNFTKVMITQNSVFQIKNIKPDFWNGSVLFIAANAHHKDR